jgi:S1-C subfamily serine protease
MPDYTWEGEGVHVDGVTEGKPASKAGLLKGDIIVGLGELVVKDIQDYMKGLSTFKKGDTTTVKVKRGAEVKTMPVTFQ